MDRIRNEHVRKTTQVAQFSDKVGEERPRWFRHMEYIGEKVLVMELPARRKGERETKEEIYGFCEGGYEDFCFQNQ